MTRLTLMGAFQLATALHFAFFTLIPVLLGIAIGFPLGRLSRRFRRRPSDWDTVTIRGRRYFREDRRQ